VPDSTVPTPSLEDLFQGGRQLRITRWGESILHRPTRAVVDFDVAFHDLVRDMLTTMMAADGVGLASTQVADDRSFFVFRCPDAEQRVQAGVVCNPVVELPTGTARHLVSEDEGCLSLPGAYAPLARPDQAICRGQDHTGAPIEIIGTGLLARCLQHETDHLAGTVFGDRLSGRLRRQLYSDHDAVAYRYPADWPITAKTEFDPTRSV
jgi:peptide deformylase